MSTYDDPDLLTDETALAELFLDTLADQISGWEPHDGQIEPPLAEAAAIIAAPIAVQLINTLRQDYEGWGTTVLRIPRIAAVSATGIADVHFAADGTLPAGARVVGTLPSGDTALFITTADVGPAVAGQTISGVQLVATEPGADSNGATGVALLDDPYAFVDLVTFTTPSAGGTDQEDATAYLDRIADRASRMVEIPVSVDDFAAAMLDIPGVARCLAINLLDPASPGVISEGHITLVPIDAAGADVAVTTSQIDARFGMSNRPLQVQIHTEGATRTPVTVTFTATPTAGADGPAMIAAAEQAVLDYLAAGVWGYDETAGGKWTRDDTVRFLEIDQRLQDTAGLDLVLDLQLNGGTADVVLPGDAPLPVPTVTGTLGP